MKQLRPFQGMIITDKPDGGGSLNYNDFSNKPQVNSHELIGNQTAESLGLVSADVYSAEIVTKANKNLDNVQLTGLNINKFLYSNSDGKISPINGPLVSGCYTPQYCLTKWYPTNNIHMEYSFTHQAFIGDNGGFTLIAPMVQGTPFRIYIQAPSTFTIYNQNGWILELLTPYVADFSGNYVRPNKGDYNTYWTSGDGTVLGDYTITGTDTPQGVEIASNLEYQGQYVCYPFIEFQNKNCEAVFAADRWGSRDPVSLDVNVRSGVIKPIAVVQQFNDIKVEAEN